MTVEFKNGFIKTYDAQGDKSFDTDESALYLQDYFEGFINTPTRNSNQFQAFTQDFIIGQCHAGADYIVGSFQIINAYTNSDWMQASNTLIFDAESTNAPVPWSVQGITPKIVGTDVIIREDTFLFGSNSVPVPQSASLVNFKIWVGGFN